jgi:hypothetical protein
MGGVDHLVTVVYTSPATHFEAAGFGRFQGCADNRRSLCFERSGEASGPVIYLALCLLLGDSISLLNAACQLVTIALDAIKVIVGEVTPLLLGLAFELHPFSLDLIPVHGFLLCCSKGNANGHHTFPNGGPPMTIIIGDAAKSRRAESAGLVEQGIDGNDPRLEITRQKGSSADQLARAKAIDMTLSASASGRSNSIGSWRVMAISTINSSMDAVGRSVLTLFEIIEASLWTGTGADFARSSSNLLISITTSASMLFGNSRMAFPPWPYHARTRGLSLEKSTYEFNRSRASARLLWPCVRACGKSALVSHVATKLPVLRWPIIHLSKRDKGE